MSLPLEPRANPSLFGHGHVAAALRDAALSGRMHHGWMLTGPRGVGKATLAWRYARWVLAGMPRHEPPGEAPLFVPGSDALFARVAAGAHADLRSLSPSTGEKGKKVLIRVEDVRELTRFLAMTPAEGGWRVVVIEELEAMNEQAQNALLKTLEEPPPRAVLMLTASAPDRLLPTIRSRVRRLDLFPLEQGLMDHVLAGWLPDLTGEDRASLARLAAGSPGRALALAEGEGLAMAREVEAFLARLPRPEPRELHALADRLAAKRDGSAFTTFFNLLRDAIAGALRRAARGQGAEPWLAGRGLAEWAGLWDMLGRLADETDTLNLDRKQAVLTGLSRLSV
ncbi:DNA polymerase III subunit delta' [Roseomonas sp. SSH11]|uniref:DNA polymerase III subunit delta n=1 Tax=Pararoseomonas baculiformis TaxID=2820812 RepID=A0ABS4AA50_9PROT|nr:DNA polymerase III subunit delta' [Pararoseomonas baculiformis]MBP0443881.1 DNA polymerase III subunit delta' [Pararoseomonas baculiformis]